MDELNQLARQQQWNYHWNDGRYFRSSKRNSLYIEVWRSNQWVNMADLDSSTLAAA